jgi:hypothetical protein
MMSRRDMLKTGGAALAGLAAIPGGIRLAADARGRHQATEEDLTSYVDPFIGTGAHGHTYPGAQVPFGMVQLSPDNGVNGWDWSSGYHWSSNRIAGFSHTHLSGTGIGDMCDILFMPAFTSGPPLRDISATFSHEREQASPGYYTVDLLTSGITAELTATDRVGVHRYTFPTAPPASLPTLVVDLGHSLNWDRPTNTVITVESPTAISGHRLSTGWAPDQRLFFAASFSRPFSSSWLQSEWADAAMRSQLEGERVKAGFQFLGGQRIVAKVAISPVSVEAAKRNLQAEVPGWDFDSVRRAAVAAWNRVLSRIRVPAASAEDRVLLYTSLYHALLAPQLFCDVDGTYRGPDGEVHQADTFMNYTVYSLWDTFRAEHPLLTLVQPERVDDLIQSMMAFHQQSGLLPVWSLAGNETNTMIGYHSVPVLLDAFAKGLTSVEPREALEAMIDSAMQDAGGLRYYRMPSSRPIAEVREEQTTTNLARIGAVERGDLDDLGTLVNGYSRSLGGEYIRYRSTYPKVRRALIVRSEDGDERIAWETGPVPDEAAGQKISFVWLAGIDAGDSRRLFELSVNGQPWINFRAPRVKDRRFSRSGPNGARLTFRATHSDQYEDQFGFMFLTLPNGLAAGTRLKLSMTAEAAGTRDWYMTFEHEMDSRLTADNVYALAEEKGERRQVVEVDVEYLGPPTPASDRAGRTARDGASSRVDRQRRGGNGNSSRAEARPALQLYTGRSGDRIRLEDAGVCVRRLVHRPTGRVAGPTVRRSGFRRSRAILPERLRPIHRLHARQAFRRKLDGPVLAHSRIAPSRRVHGGERVAVFLVRAPRRSWLDRADGRSRGVRRQAR